MRTIEGVDALRALVGHDLGTTDWHTVTQERIQAFADATEDWERLHVDPVRAAETPWGVTIAHGLYTLSLGPKFLYELFTVTGHRLGLNYGYDKVRWLAPVKVGSRLRMTAKLVGEKPIDGGSRFTVVETFEVEGEPDPVCVAEAVIAYFD